MYSIDSYQIWVEADDVQLFSRNNHLMSITYKVLDENIPYKCVSSTDGINWNYKQCSTTHIETNYVKCECIGPGAVAIAKEEDGDRLTLFSKYSIFLFSSYGLFFIILLLQSIPCCHETGIWPAKEQSWKYKVPFMHILIYADVILQITFLAINWQKETWTSIPNMRIYVTIPLSLRFDLYVNAIFLYLVAYRRHLITKQKMLVYNIIIGLFDILIIGSSLAISISMQMKWEYKHELFIQTLLSMIYVTIGLIFLLVFIVYPYIDTKCISSDKHTKNTFNSNLRSIAYIKSSFIFLTIYWLLLTTQSFIIIVIYYTELSINEYSLIAFSSLALLSVVIIVIPIWKAPYNKCRKPSCKSDKNTNGLHDKDSLDYDVVKTVETMEYNGHSKNNSHVITANSMDQLHSQRTTPTEFNAHALIVTIPKRHESTSDIDIDGKFIAAKSSERKSPQHIIKPINEENDMTQNNENYLHIFQNEYTYEHTHNTHKSNNSLNTDINDNNTYPNGNNNSVYPNSIDNDDRSQLTPMNDNISNNNDDSS